MATIKFSIPDVPYSQLEWDATDDPREAMAAAQAIRNAYLEAFGQQAPVLAQSAPRQSNGNGQSNGTSAHTGLFCPDHPSIELVPSKPEYQTYDFLPDGTQVPAKYFCPKEANGTGKNHNVWRSKALQREAVEELPF